MFRSLVAVRISPAQQRALAAQQFPERARSALSTRFLRGVVVSHNILVDGARTSAASTCAGC